MDRDITIHCRFDAEPPVLVSTGGGSVDQCSEDVVSLEHKVAGCFGPAVCTGEDESRSEISLVDATGATKRCKCCV